MGHLPLGALPLSTWRIIPETGEKGNEQFRQAGTVKVNFSQMQSLRLARVAIFAEIFRLQSETRPFAPLPSPWYNARVVTIQAKDQASHPEPVEG
jgi:hypothetical protein